MCEEKVAIVKYRLFVFPEADRDLEELAGYIARTSEASALRFYDAVEHTYGRIVAAPESVALYGFTRAEMTDLRVRSVRGFPNHLIFYRALHGEVQIVRLLHAARDLSAGFPDQN
ncbi:MAG: type II toxin-antitoxin system RelE/ParE family toxin [Planctomycetaceae bacterium]|nr:type II toxin-antitoxin system RelE/ParE family toxin [Planctomycetaceae bacterium]